MRLGFANVLGARTLGALPGLERHGLPLTERVERLARGLVEEVLLPRRVGHETEALVRNDTLDSALGCHVKLPVQLNRKTPSDSRRGESRTSVSDSSALSRRS